MTLWLVDRSNEEPIRAMVFDIKYRAEFLEANELAVAGEELVKLSMRLACKKVNDSEYETDTFHDMRRARNTVAIGYRHAMEHLAAFRECEHDKRSHAFAECAYASAAMAWQDTKRLIAMIARDPYCSLNNRELGMSMNNDMDKATIGIIDETWKKVKDKLGKHEKHRTIRTFPPYLV